MNASMLTPAWRIPSVKTQKAAMTAFAKLDLKKARLANASVSIPPCSRSCCSFTLWCSMTDRLAGSKWGTLFFVRGARRARHRGMTHAFTRGACLALHARFVLEKTRLKKRAKKVIVPVLQAGTQLSQESLGIAKPNEADTVRCQPRSHGV